jgi:hypothetical protein
MTCERPDVAAQPEAPAAGLGSAGATDDGPAAPGAAPVTFTVGRLSAAQRRSWGRTGKVALKVRVSDGAVVTALARARIGGKTVTAARATSSRTTAGSVTLALKLSTKAAAQLRRTGRLALTLRVTCSDAAAASRPVSLTLRRVAAKAPSKKTTKNKKAGR